MQEACKEFDHYYADRCFDRDMEVIAEKLNDLLDSAIAFQNYEQMPTLVNIFSRAMYMSFKNAMVNMVND